MFCVEAVTLIPKAGSHQRLKSGLFDNTYFPLATLTALIIFWCFNSLLLKSHISDSHYFARGWCYTNQLAVNWVIPLIFFLAVGTLPLLYWSLCGLPRFILNKHEQARISQPAFLGLLGASYVKIFIPVVYCLTSSLVTNGLERTSLSSSDQVHHLAALQRQSRNIYRNLLPFLCHY